jgi:predicted anti-sigma-YlaC factor YlaD
MARMLPTVAAGRGWNRTARPGDYLLMRCDVARLALSARLDGEDPPVPDGDVNEHVGSCAACRAWLAGAQRVTRAVRVQPVEVPDLTVPILAAVQAEGLLAGVPKRRAGWAAGRLAWALAVAAIVQLMIAVPELLGSAGHDAHAGREVAALDIAFAVGLLVTACYPEYARVFAPVVITLVICFASASALDIMQGAVTPGRTAVHVLAVAQAALVWMLARATPLAASPAAPLAASSPPRVTPAA